MNDKTAEGLKKVAYKQQINYSDILIGIFHLEIILIFLQCFNTNSLKTYILFFLSVVALFIILKHSKISYLYSPYLFYFQLLLICGILNYLIIMEITFPNLGMYITYAILAFLLMNYRTNEKLTLLLYYMLTGYLYIKLAQGVDANLVFGHISRNGISAYLLFFITLYYIQCEKKKKKRNVLHVLFCLPVIFWAVGRSGILSFAVLTAGMMFEFICKTRNFFLKLLYVLLGGTAAAIIFYCFYDFIYYAVQHFIHFGFTSPRLDIIKTYITDAVMQLKTIFLGFNIQDNFFYEFYNYNLHNSFLVFHKNLGLMPLAYFLFMLIISVLQYIRRKNFFFITIIITLGIRSFTDTLAFQGIYDIIWLYIVFNITKKETRRYIL